MGGPVIFVSYTYLQTWQNKYVKVDLCQMCQIEDKKQHYYNG